MPEQYKIVGGDDDRLARIRADVTLERRILLNVGDVPERLVHVAQRADHKHIALWREFLFRYVEVLDDEAAEVVRRHVEHQSVLIKLVVGYEHDVVRLTPVDGELQRVNVLDKLLSRSLSHSEYRTVCRAVLHSPALLIERQHALGHGADVALRIFGHKLLHALLESIVVAVLSLAQRIDEQHLRHQRRQREVLLQRRVISRHGVERISCVCVICLLIKRVLHLHHHRHLAFVVRVFQHLGV